jgi:hypothetical protein
MPLPYYVRTKIILQNDVIKCYDLISSETFLFSNSIVKGMRKPLINNQNCDLTLGISCKI